MKSKTGWILAIVIGLLALFLLPSLLMGRWAGGYGGMMGGGGYLHPMMGGWGFWSPLGFIGMALMWLVPAGLLFLLVLGAVALFNSLTRTGNAAPPALERKCQNCNKPAQSDWTTCPYCGNSLSSG